MGSAPVSIKLVPPVTTFLGLVWPLHNIPLPHNPFLLKRAFYGGKQFFLLKTESLHKPELSLNSLRSACSKRVPLHPCLFHEIFNEIGGGMTEGLRPWE